MAGNSLITTEDACQIMADIIKRQAALIEQLVSALGPFESYEAELRRIEKQKEKVAKWVT